MRGLQKTFTLQIERMCRSLFTLCVKEHGRSRFGVACIHTPILPITSQFLFHEACKVVEGVEVDNGMVVTGG